MDPDGEQIVRAMTLAIERSGRALEEIGYVNYHGTSTVLNDAVESRCVRRLFGDRADLVPGSSTKSMIGHPQGASGAAGIVTTALALSRGFLPPTINQRERDPDCDLDFIPNVGARGVTGRGALQLPRVRIEEQRHCAGDPITWVFACHDVSTKLTKVTVIQPWAGVREVVRRHSVRRRPGGLGGRDRARARRGARAAGRSRAVSARQAVRRHHESRHRRDPAAAGARPADSSRARCPWTG